MCIAESREASIERTRFYFVRRTCFSGIYYFLICDSIFNVVMADPPRTHEDYQIGVICALATEKAAMVAMMDEIHPRLQRKHGDENEYTLGRIRAHNIVIVCLPAGLMGSGPAAIVANNMLRSFPIKIGLMVGVGGGVWSKENDIRLGDVVVSQPTVAHSGVVQWDFGKMGNGGKFQRTGSLDKPPQVLLHALQELKTFNLINGVDIKGSLAFMAQNNPRMGQTYRYQGADRDQLFEASYDHEGDKNCDKCDSKFIIQRTAREDSTPRIHYGNIASGNEVIKHGITRDKIATEEGVICFEMEAAGLMDNFKCLVLRGICDYADSHKNKIWQPYAAATAAAFARELLGFVDEQEVIKAPHTSTIGHRNTHWMVPRAINDLFTGRTKLLRRIQKALDINHTSIPNHQKRFVITGLGGQGKSEICLMVASQMRREFWGVFWVDVGNASTAKRDFIAIATLLERPVENIPDALQVLATTKQSWLLILDNADNPNFDYQAYFPSGNQGAVLMTSRVPECKRYSPGASEALEGLEDEDSKELLLKAADIPKELWLSHNDQAEKVVRILGSHTLALIQAGAYIAKGHCRLHQYPMVYRRQRERLLSYRPEQARSRYCDVYATFEASAEVLEQSKSEDAKDALCLLKILSMLDSAILPLRIFQSAWDGGKEVLRTTDKKIREMDALSRNHILLLPSFLVAEDDEWDPYRLIEASSRLVSLSLITRHDLDYSVGLSMHLIAHAWAKDREDREQQARAWIAAGCVLALSRFNYVLWQTQERLLLPHIQSYLDLKIGRVVSFGPETVIVPILLSCAWALLDMRQDSRLGYLLEDMFTELRKNIEEPLKEFLPLYNLQARSLLNLGKNKRAVSLLEQVVLIQETTLAKNHPNRLASQHVLATAYQANGQVKEAVDLLEQVVKIQETTLAKNDLNRLASQHALATAYQEDGQVKKAVDLLEQVVEIQETTLAIDHPNRLASQQVLATIYQASGQVKEAVSLLEQVVKIQETILAKDHPYRLASQQVLATAYQENGQVKKAVGLLEQVVVIQETILAIDH
ncbi:hypothetical protein BGZ60DRAFT_499727, partial [Tricladium varicosporioides]